jgi:SM-20-related protein
MNSAVPEDPAFTLRIDLDRLADDLRGPGWSVLPEAVGIDACLRLRDEARAAREEGAFRAAGVGRGRAWRLDPSLRGDEVLWVGSDTGHSAREAMLREFGRLGPELNRRLFMGLVDYEAHLAVSPAGKGYRRHRDHFLGSETRAITTTLYLNEGWETEDGGEIRLFIPDADPVEILPSGGKLVAFLSQDFEHEILPPRRERWSWTGWFRRADAGRE